MQRTTVVEPEWMTTEEVMEELGRSKRTIQKLAKRGELKWKVRPNEVAGRPIRMYARADVNRVAQFGPQTSEEARPKTQNLVRIPKQERHAKVIESRLEKALGTIEITGQFLVAMKDQQAADRDQRRFERDADQQRMKDDREDKRERWDEEKKIRAAEIERREAAEQRERELAKPWLTLKSAVEFSGLTRTQILQLCESGTIVAVNSGGWRINRASLVATFDGAPLTRSIAVAKARRAHA